jgi:hypothetical protein
MKGMGKWLCGAYIAVMVLYVLVHAWSWSWSFALWAALWILLVGSAVITSFGYLAAKASMPRPAGEYLGKDDQVRIPLLVRVLTWSAFGVLLLGWALILFEVFSKF